ncbi:MAG: hypothetical protein Fues2KO_51900 [Fuerstiella sp.]
MSSEIMEALRLLERIAVAVEALAGVQEEPKKRLTTDEERGALAIVAVAKGATTLTEVARELGISRSTASRNPAVRRALETTIRDRRGGEAEEDYQWHP